MRKSKIYVALLHSPMYNKRMENITTSITNLDLHDISRTSRTYNAQGFFIVHPSPNQQNLISNIISYWQEGFGGTYNADRKDAFNIVKLATDLDEVKEIINKETGKEVYTIATDARIYPNTINYIDLKHQINNDEKVFLILFGTGWGMTKELIETCDYILHPIEPIGDYNHLSVRSAVAIILDRLLGEYWFK